MSWSQIGNRNVGVIGQIQIQIQILQARSDSKAKCGRYWWVIGRSPSSLFFSRLLPIHTPTHFTNVTSVKRFSVLEMVFKKFCSAILIPQLFHPCLLSWIHSNISRYVSIKSLFSLAYLPASINTYFTPLVTLSWFKRLFWVVICESENL